MSDSVPRAAGKRERLPTRRPSETRRLEWAGRRIHVTIGYDPVSREPREIFYNGGYRSGSDMEALVSDLCIALSVMLQHEGIAAATLAKSMGEAFDLVTGDPHPASVLGVLLKELSRPPGFTGLLAAGDGSQPSSETETSGAGDVEDLASGEAGRRDPTPGPAAAARHAPQSSVPRAAENGEATS